MGKSVTYAADNGCCQKGYAAEWFENSDAWCCTASRGLVLAVPVSPQQPLDLRTERTGVCEPRHAVPSSTVALL